MGVVQITSLNNIKERRQDVSVVNIPDELSLVSGDQFHVMDRHNVSLLMSPDPDHVCHHGPVVMVTSAPANSKLRASTVRHQTGHAQNEGALCQTESQKLCY